MLLSPEQAAAEKLLWRRSLRENLVVWAEFIIAEKGYQLADHHRHLLGKLQQVTDGTLLHSVTKKPCKNIIISMPPGAAKSTYGSVVFPTWAIQRLRSFRNVAEPRVLACSHSADLIEGFSRECRNTVAVHHKTLGYNLRPDSKSVQAWATTNQGAYRCAGVGAGIAGLRADLGIIDDFCGSQEDADSKLIRDKVWAWYISDFWSRLKPGALQIVIATRWHEEDLIGRLTDPKNSYNSPEDPQSWEYVKFPFFAEEGDQLGRPVGQRLWMGWFDEEKEKSINRLPPRIKAGLYQQRPAPEEGNFFKKDWLRGYTQTELDELMKRQPRIYAAGDWAVSEEDDANRSCFGPVARDHDGSIWILPDLFWKIAGPKEVVESFLQMLKRRKPLQTWSEKGHISKAWGPFLRDRMIESDTYAYITEVTPARAKDVRARSIQGMMSMGQVRFPHFAHWWPEAMHELLTFPGGKTDDFVDYLAHIGMGINSIIKTLPLQETPVEDLNAYRPITLSWVMKSHKDRLKANQPAYQGR